MAITNTNSDQLVEIAMTNKSKLIGILGGTFDPIHKGHVRIAEEIAKLPEFSKVLVVPCHIPVHREQPSASAIDRYNMTKLAFANSSNKIQVSKIEIERQTPSYAVETLRMLKNEYPNNTLCWIMGSDAFTKFDKWHKANEILDIASLIFVKRIGQEFIISNKLHDILNERSVNSISEFIKSYNGKILTLPLNPPEVAANQIRKKILANISVKSLIPEVVWNYIIEKGLYFNDKNKEQ